MLAAAAVAVAWVRSGDRSPASVPAPLRSLPYAAAAPVPTGETRWGIVRHDPERACPGLNLCAPLDRPHAILFDLEGRVFREWSGDFGVSGTWQHVEPLPDGGLLALAKHAALLRLDAKGRRSWLVRGEFHHDIALLRDGTILVLESRRREVGTPGGKAWIRDDLVVRIAPDGRPVDSVAIYPLVESLVPASRLDAARRSAGDPLRQNGPGDILHTNSLDVLERDVAGLGKRGDVLLCVRELDLVAVIDPRAGTLRSAWSPEGVDRPHHASLLGNDHLLLFDNGRNRRYSRVLELDPRRRRVVWEYRVEGFHTPSRGSCQRLPNGNTLICESDAGRAFEVTPEGEVVWEYLAPLDERKPERSTMYRMRRLTPGEAAPFLDR